MSNRNMSPWPIQQGFLPPFALKPSFNKGGRYCAVCWAQANARLRRMHHAVRQNRQHGQADDHV